MKHARSDYDRIQDPALKDPSLLGPGCSPIAEDEPVFVVRAQDVFAPHVLLDYAARCEESGLADMAVTCRRHAGRMFEWQQARRMKLPDLPTQAAPKEPKKPSAKPAE